MEATSVGLRWAWLMTVDAVFFGFSDEIQGKNDSKGDVPRNPFPPLMLS